MVSVVHMYISPKLIICTTFFFCTWLTLLSHKQTNNVLKLPVNLQSITQPHPWHNGKRARLHCGRSWVQTKDNTIGICCFSAKHAALRRNIKYWMARNQGNALEWGDMSISGSLFQWTSTNKSKIKRVGLVQITIIILAEGLNTLVWRRWRLY